MIEVPPVFEQSRVTVTETCSEPWTGMYVYENEYALDPTHTFEGHVKCWAGEAQVDGWVDGDLRQTLVFSTIRNTLLMERREERTTDRWVTAVGAGRIALRWLRALARQERRGADS